MLAACRADGFAPTRVLEPTCGSGAFLAAAAAAFPAARELVGIEYQRERYGPALGMLAAREPRLRVHYDNAYETDFAAIPWQGSGSLLVVGNPPWVTAAALGRIAVDRSTPSVLQPARANLKRLRGLAARTGASNFDVAEFLLVKLLRSLRERPLLLAMLVKESVARHLLAANAQLELGIARAEIVRIDARAWFGVSVDACCLLASNERAAAASDDRTACARQHLICVPAVPNQPRTDALGAVTVRSGFGERVVATIVTTARADSRQSSVVFRQGIKHDAADVFELSRAGDGTWRNGYAENVDIESEFVYPLCKAGALHAGRVDPTALIITQTRLGEPTATLEQRAPRLWRYLLSHAGRLAARKSSIYRGAPPFALFGIGPYSFAPWKVAVAGLYAEPRFRLIGPHDGRPVVLGDTAYFVAFAAEREARAFAGVCASDAVRAAIGALIVRGKRPITKALLDRIDWDTLVKKARPTTETLTTLMSETIVI